MFLASSTTSNGLPEGSADGCSTTTAPPRSATRWAPTSGTTMAYAGDIDALEVVAWNISHGRNPDGTHK